MNKIMFSTATTVLTEIVLFWFFKLWYYSLKKGRLHTTVNVCVWVSRRISGPLFLFLSLDYSFQLVLHRQEAQLGRWHAPNCLQYAVTAITALSCDAIPEEVSYCIRSIMVLQLYVRFGILKELFFFLNFHWWNFLRKHNYILDKWLWRLNDILF